MKTTAKLLSLVILAAMACTLLFSCGKTYTLYYVVSEWSDDYKAIILGYGDEVSHYDLDFNDYGDKVKTIELSGDGEVEIPEKIEGYNVAIDGGAFDDCTSIKSVTIPASVDIEGNPFEGCSDSLVIRGERGSEAEEMADKNDLRFEVIG